MFIIICSLTPEPNLFTKEQTLSADSGWQGAGKFVIVDITHHPSNYVILVSGGETSLVDNFTCRISSWRLQASTADVLDLSLWTYEALIYNLLTCHFECIICPSSIERNDALTKYRQTDK